MRFEILGPLWVRADGNEVAITQRRERVLLAMLLLHANQPVSLAQLADAIWQEQMPEDPRTPLQGCVSRLRKRLSAAGNATMLATEPNGYRIAADAETLDLLDFRLLVSEARAAAREDRNGRATERYRTALGLWRGPALAGIDSIPVQGAAAGLEEERIQAWEECLQCELAGGAAGELVAELTELAAQHPLREGPHRSLMLALYRCGRQADALSIYRQFRQRLADELGTEPGDDLQQLHRGILNRDPALASDRTSAGSAVDGVRTAVPRELPAAVADFTGRTAALATLDELLAASQATDQPGPVVISAIAGTAGVGKTALAVNWAHRVADRFPDGQLYINLRGYAAGATPLRPIDALAALLRSLGTPPEQIPTEEDQATALYRTRLADRRVLIVLDNVRSSDQVRPLLPGAAGCLVLLTSRDRLTSLVATVGARRVTLDVLTPDQAHTLLVRLLGKVRVDAEPEAVAALAEACAYLPLALRIAAANLTEPAGRSIASYLAELTGRDHRADDDADVETDEVAAVYSALGASYRSIPPSTQRLFRLLGLVPGPDVTAPAAAALAALSEAEARRELRRLAVAHLVDEHVPDRFTFHDLLRSYARDLAHREDQSAECEHALNRLFNWYLYSTGAATIAVNPAALLLPLETPAGDTPTVALTDGGQAKAWFEAERSNLIAAALHVAKTGPPSLAWLLADRLRYFLLLGGHTSDWHTIATKALAIAERANAQQAVAAAHFSLGGLALTRSRYREAIAHLTTAREIVHRVGWSDAEPRITKLLGESYWYAGQLERAATYLRESVALDRTANRPAAVPVALGNLGCVYQELGRLHEAAQFLTENLALRRRLDDRPAIASALNNLGLAHLELGNFDEAADRLNEALHRCQELGLRYGEAHTLDSLAAVHRDRGRLTDAVDLAQAAIAAAQELGDRRTEAAAMNTLGSVQLYRGHASDALGHHEVALQSAREFGALEASIIALLGQASARHRLGKPDSAYGAAHQALEIARKSQFQVLVGQALTLLADLNLTRDRIPEARDHADEALATHRATGYRLGEARTLALLGRIASATGDTNAAIRYAQAARTRFTELGVANPDEGPSSVR